MKLSMAAVVQADVNRRWKQGPVVEATGGWVGELCCTRARGWVGWAGKWPERAGTDAVLDSRLGSGRELGGAEMMEAKRGKLKSGVHPP
jgi:hypothetical protein